MFSLVERALGAPEKTVTAPEIPLRAFAKRALHALRDIAAGETLRENHNYAILRPGFRQSGLHPSFFIC